MRNSRAKKKNNVCKELEAGHNIHKKCTYNLDISFIFFFFILHRTVYYSYYHNYLY